MDIRYFVLEVRLCSFVDEVGFFIIIWNRSCDGTGREGCRGRREIV